MSAVFGSMLRQQMAYQGMTVATLAAASGVGKTTINALRRGDRLPLLASAARLADALLAPSLLRYVTQQRTATCADCGRSFVFDAVGGKPRIYCSERCQKVSWNRAKRKRVRLQWTRTHTRWSRKYHRAQEAIDAMCNECVDWEGVCRTAKCPLRSVSPLPLVVEVVA